MTKYLPERHRRFIVLQTYGDRINHHVHLHFPVTEGGTDEAAVSPVLMNRKRFMSAGVFHKIPRIDESRLAGIFAPEVLAMLVRKELLSPDIAERLPTPQAALPELLWEADP